MVIIIIGERDTYRGNTIENRGCQFIYRRASVASKTLTGVTQSKIGDVCLFIYLLASERSERDTLRGNTIEISLYLFIYLFMGYVRPLFSHALLIT